MADISTVVQLIFSGDAASARKAIGQIKNDLSSLESGIQGIAAPFADFATILLQAEAAALALATALGVTAVKEAIKFEDSLYLVEKQLTGTNVSIDEARLKIEGLGQQYGINANEVAASVAGFLAAGYEYEQAAQLVETSTQFMIAAEISAADATEILNRSLSGFRIEADDATEGAVQIADAINKVGDISSGPIEELAEGFARISPTAKDAGLSIEETAAIIAKMVDVSYSGEQSATALKSGLLSLIAPSTEAENAMAELGIALTDNEGQLKNSKTLLEELAGKWDTLTAAQQQQTAAVIFGKDQAGAMSDVLGGWATVQDYLNQLLDETTGAVGSMAREVEGKLDLISASVAKTDEIWRQFLENLGTELLSDPDENLSGLISAIGELGNSLKEVVNQGGLDPLIELAQQQAGEFEELILSVAENIPAAFEQLDWTKLTESFELLGEEIKNLFSAFFGDIDITTVEGLTSALQMLTDGFAVLTTAVAGILAQFEPVIAMLREGTLEFQSLDQASQMDFGEFLGAMKLVTDAGVGVGLALIAIGEAGLEMAEVMDVVFGAMKFGVNALQIAFDGLLLAVTSPIALIAKGIAELDDAIRKFKGTQNTPFSPMRQDVEKMLTYFGAIAKNLEKNAKEANEGLEKIGKGFGIIDDAARTAAENGLENAKSKLNELGASAKKVAGDFKTLGDEVNDALASVDKTVAGLADFKITTPSLDFGDDPFGVLKEEWEDLSSGLVGNPFEDAIDGVNAFTDAAEDAGFGTKEFADTVKKAAEEAAKGATDGKKSMIEWGNAIESLPEVKPPDGVEKTIAVFQEAGKSAGDLTGAVEGVSTSYESLDGKTVKATGAFAENNKQVNDAISAQEQFNKVLGGTGNSVEVVTSAFNTYLSALGSNGKLTTDQIIELTTAANDFQVKMEEIASNEKIKVIESQVNLDIAKLEADTKQVEAAFGSINTTIESTGEVLGDLYGEWGQATGLDKYQVESWIREENKRRDEAISMQNALIEAQIENVKAKTDAMTRGDALITVNGDGLQPHLEAFMWEVLKAIQVQASADMQQFLLGVD